MNPIVPKRLYVRPGPGLKVRDPESGQHIPDEGAWLADSKYLRRRLKAGDLVEARMPKPPRTSTAPAPAAKSEGK